jgi:hypothetical protein
MYRALVRGGFGPRTRKYLRMWRPSHEGIGWSQIKQPIAVSKGLSASIL